jgi:hypothetical protein
MTGIEETGRDLLEGEDLATIIKRSCFIKQSNCWVKYTLLYMRVIEINDLGWLMFQINLLGSDLRNNS